MGLSFTLLILILINAAFTYKGLEDRSFLDKYKFNVGAVKHGDYYRLLTGAFLHGSWMHFFVNMFTLYFFFPIVENALGTAGALAVYLAGILGGNLAAYYFHRHDLWYSAVGNSGAVNAILFASILIYPGLKIYIMPIPIPIPSIVYAVGYLFYTAYGMERQQGLVGHEAHWGGALAGVLTVILWEPRLLTAAPYRSLGILLLLILIFLYIQKKSVR